jgi:hypothetical protein
LSTDHSEEKIQRFVEAYFQSKDGEITQQSNDSFKVTLSNNKAPEEYTYQPSVAREKKVPLLSAGSPAFQQILKDCLGNGVLCQILLKPRENYEALLRSYFKDAPFNCQGCSWGTVREETVHFCIKSQPCYHQINNAKITGAKAAKTEPIKYLQFYFSVTFHNRLRSKNEETIAILIDEKGEVIIDGFYLDDLLQDSKLEIEDYKVKLKPDVFERLRNVADQKLAAALKEKVAFFDLPLDREKKGKLRSFEKRLRKERREQVISKKHDFDFQRWQANYDALLNREEESYITNIAIKLTNLLVINTTKVRCELNLDNHATIETSFVLGVQQPLEVTCPICKKPFTEGYATKDGLYVCGHCIRQSIDTGKIYSKKAHLCLDEKINEYFESEAGFICSVCGKKHSRLLEFKCSHDNSSICINHYDLCDDCGEIFSKANLSHTDEFKNQLCPLHAAKGKGAEK